MKTKLLTTVSLIISMISLNVGGLSIAHAAETVVLIDNADAVISYQGQKISDNASNGYYGDNYNIISDGATQITPTVTTNGYYKLYIRWPEFKDGGEIRIKVTDSANKEYSTVLDQSMNSGYWVFAGTFFMKKDVKPTIEISSADNNKYIFDALRLELSAETSVNAKSSWFENPSADIEDNDVAETEKPTVTFSSKDKYSFLTRLTSVFAKKKAEESGEDKPAKITAMKNVGDEMIFDNSAADFTTGGGTWKKQSDKEAYGGTYMSDGSIDPNFTQTAKWKPSITTDGKYEIYLFCPNVDNLPGRTRISVKDSSNVIGKSYVNQSENAGKWALVGEYDMYGGVQYAVTMGANAAGITVADAVKFKLVSTEVPKREETEYSYDENEYASYKQDKYNIVLDDNNKFFFTKNGSIFNINGACYSNTAKHLEEGMKYFVDAGGNMVRTYGINVLDSGFLDYAYKQGIGVMAGIFIPKTAFTYSNEKEYRTYVEQQKAAVDKYKNHPALVMWSVNNESESADTAGEVYAMIEEISEYIKSVDPYHPISTSFAGCNAERHKKLKSLAPSVEILGMNSYMGINSVYPSTVESGWNAPIMVTEYGPNGTWGSECTRTTWNTIIEQNNSEKADLYRERHLNAIMNNNKGIGGFAFCLPYAIGNEGTLTWYGFVYNGMRTPIFDEMQYAWTGKYPSNLAPRMSSFTINGREAADNVIVSPGENLNMSVIASDKDGDALTYNFDIREEIQGDLTGKYPDIISSADNPQNKTELTMKAPSDPGYYRVYASASDGHGNVDANNIPIYVKPVRTGENNSEEISKMLENGAAKYAESGRISAKVEVNSYDNLNGMPYTGNGNATLETDGTLVYIASDVTYQTDGRQQTEAYIGKETSYILNAENTFSKVTDNTWYDVLSAYDKIVKNKNDMSKFTLDDVSDNEYHILSGDIFVTEFYPYALSGIDSAEFMTEKDNPDAYSLVIYISKSTGKIEKAIATAGYVRSAEKAEYRKLQYTYTYNYDGNFEIAFPYEGEN